MIIIIMWWLLVWWLPSEFSNFNFQSAMSDVRNKMPVRVKVHSFHLPPTQCLWCIRALCVLVCYTALHFHQMRDCVQNYLQDFCVKYFCDAADCMWQVTRKNCSDWMQYQIPFFIIVEIVVPIRGIKYYFIGRIEVREAISFNKKKTLYSSHQVVSFHCTCRVW